MAGAGHIPGYEGWTDNTDPVGAFDGFGNYYQLHLAYQFFYNTDGSHNFTVGKSQEPNPVQPAEVISVSVRPHGAMNATDWKTTVNGHQDFVATYDSVGGEPDKQWITTWSVVSTPVNNATLPPLIYPNTTFRDGITDTFAVGNHLDAQERYPLYIAYEDYSAAIGNILLTASYDGGTTWTTPIQVNDNASPVDEFQPNVAVADDGTVSVNFYDRRLACPAAGTAEAAAAGIALDQTAQNPDYTGPVPPYGASNYCVNASIQFYTPTLTPLGQNVRLTQHTWDPQLNAPHPGSPTDEETFIGDYFGNTTSGSTDISTFVSTYNDGSNPGNYQQQVVAKIAIP